MKIGLLAVILILTTAILVPAVGATGDITAKVGETWIKWTWSSVLPCNINVDGTSRVLNSTLNYFYLSGLEPLETHNIVVVNGSNVSEIWQTSTVTTLHQKWVIYFITAIEILLTLVLLLSKNQMNIILIGVVTIVLALYASSISTGYGGLYLLPIIVAVVSGAYLAYVFWQGIKEGAKWY